MFAFAFGDASNVSVVSNSSFHEIAEMIITENATPALWFYAAGGMILITLALNKLVTSLPRGNGVLYFPENDRTKQVWNIDKYEWGQTISRLLMGSLVIALTAMDVNASSDFLDVDLRYQSPVIWSFAANYIV